MRSRSQAGSTRPRSRDIIQIAACLPEALLWTPVRLDPPSRCCSSSPLRSRGRSSQHNNSSPPSRAALAPSPSTRPFQTSRAGWSPISLARTSRSCDNGKPQTDLRLRQRHPADHDRGDARPQRAACARISRWSRRRPRQFVHELPTGDKARIGSFATRIQIDPRRLHQRQARDGRDPADRAAAGGPDAALERRQRRDDRAPASGEAPRRARLHRRRGRADELQLEQRHAEGRDEARRRGERDGLRHRPRRPERLPRRRRTLDGTLRRLRRRSVDGGAATDVLADRGWRSPTKGSRRSPRRPAAATSS